MNEVCTDNRFELIAKYKARLVEATNIETSQEEMAVIDNILFRFWQMGWLDKLEKSERTGEWIECEYYDGDVYYECSECKEDFCLIDGNPADNLYNYCPNCGSHNPTIKRVEGEEE